MTLQDLHRKDLFVEFDPARALSAFEVKAARAGKGVGETVVVPLTPTAEMLKAGMDDLGWWVEPHNDMSTADAASINAMQMAVIEGLYRAMLAAAPALPSLEPQGAQEAVAKPLDPLKWVKHVSLDGKDIWFEAKTTICEYIAHPNGRWGCRELSIRERGQGDSLDDAKEAARKHYLALSSGQGGGR